MTGDNRIKTMNIQDMKMDTIYFTNNTAYRTMSNLQNSVDLYKLARLHDDFVWEKSNDNGFFSNDSMNSEPIDNITFIKNIIPLQNENKRTDLMLFKFSPGDNTFTARECFKTLNYPPEPGQNIIWDNTDGTVETFNNYMESISITRIPSHIDLTSEYTYLDEQVNSEPLFGWHDLCEDRDDSHSNVNDVINDVVNDVVNDTVNDDDYMPLKSSDDFNVPRPRSPTPGPEVNTHRVSRCHSSSDSSSYESFNGHDVDSMNEMRVDPYDNNYYSLQEFLDYYGGRVEWDHQEPKKVLLRNEYHKFTENNRYLNTKIFKFLFKEYKSTFA